MAFLLDSIPNVIAWWGFRKLKTSYAGPSIRVKNVSTNAEIDLPQNFSKATADAAGTDLEIVKFYDLTGNGHHLAVLNHPARNYLLFDSNSVPYYVTGGELFRSVDTFSLTNPKYFDVINYRNANAGRDDYIHRHGGGYTYLNHFYGTYYSIQEVSGVSFLSASSFLNAWHQISTLYLPGNDRAFLDGIEQTGSNTNDAGNGTETGSHDLFNYVGSPYTLGYWRESGVIDGAISDADRVAIESSQIAFDYKLKANFSLSSSPYNYGSSLTATDTTTGGSGALTRVWKVDGVTSSQSDPLHPIFSGLAIGLRTISETVTDSDDLSNPSTKSFTIYVGQITPGNFFVPTSGSQEFTFTIANAIATVSGAVGTFGTGSTAYKKLFTATAAGTATLTATGSAWGILSAGLALQADDTLKTTTTGSYIYQTGAGRLTQAGDKVSIIYRYGIGLLFRDNSTSYQIGVDYFGNYQGNGGGYLGGGCVDGDTLEWRLVASNLIELRCNGVLKFTTTGNSYSTNSSQDTLYISYYSNPVGTVLNRPTYSGLGIVGIISESTTVTVYTPPSISTSSPLPSVVIGNNFAQQLTAAGGSGAGTWSIVSNDAAQPIALSSSGLATRAATLLGTINFTVRFTDSNTAYGSVDKAFQLVITLPPPAPPIITSKTPLPYGQIGHSYSYQLKKLGGAGTGTWMMIAGNLPDGALSPSGLITIPSVGASNYSFSVRYTDDAGFDQEGLTIPVSVYAAITFIYKRPLQIDYIQKQRYFEPLEGEDEVIEDAPMKREFTLNVLFTNRAEGDYLRQFLSDHRNRQTFLWVNPDRNNEVLTVKMVSKFSEQQLYADGYFQIVIREV